MKKRGELATTSIPEEADLHFFAFPAIIELSHLYQGTDEPNVQRKKLPTATELRRRQSKCRGVAQLGSVLQWG